MCVYMYVCLGKWLTYMYESITVKPTVFYTKYMVMKFLS